MNNIGLKIMLAAIAVNGPRFVFTYLVADNLRPPTWLEATILAVTGIATGIVLTGGGAYIAHELIRMRGHLGARIFMGACWIALLVSTVILLAPLLASSLVTSELSKVLDTPGQRWLWSIVAVVAVEVLAAGAMVAYAGGSSVETVAAQPKRRGALAKLLDAASDAAVAKLNQSVVQPSPQPIAPLSETPLPQPVADVAQRHKTLLRLLNDIELPGGINKAALGRQLGVSRTQIGKDIEALTQAGRLSVNGTVKVLS